MCYQCDFGQFLENIKAMINEEDHKYAFAFDTLKWIRETVERTGHVTFGQSIAISNIEEVARVKGG